MTRAQDGTTLPSRGNSVFADAETDREFTERGYVVRPLLAPEQIRAVEHLHDEIFPDLDADFSATILNDSSDCRVRVSSGVRDIVGEPLRRMFPHHKLVVATFVTKRAATTRGRLPLHQDWWVVDNRVHRGVHCWCPLVDVGPENGCLRVVPGVHRLLNHPYPIHPKFRTTYHPRLPDLDRTFAVPVSMPAGAVRTQQSFAGSDAGIRV